MGKKIVAVLLGLALLAVCFPTTTIATFAEELSHHDLYPEAKEKVTRLHFFFQETTSGKPPSVVRIAQAPETNTSSTNFGALWAADDQLTEGPEPTSKEVGRAQGLYASVARKESNLIMALSFSFTEGKYNGSSFTLMTRNPTTHTVRELGIVGGTGVFRLARGFVVAKTFSINATAGNVTVEYNATLLHY